MQNIILAFPNRADLAILSGGSWSANAPRANLQDTDVELYARTADLLAASTTMDIALDKARPIRVAGMINDNISTTGTYRLRASNTAGDFSAPLFDSGITDRWPAIYPFGTADWLSDEFWSGRLTEEGRAGYPANLLVVLPHLITARYWRWEVFDSSNAAGYLQFGRAFIAPAWQPVYNYSYGATLRRVPLTTVERGPSGRKYFDRKKSYREFVFTLDWIGEDEAYADALEADLRLDLDGEVVVIPDADDNVHQIRRSFMGNLGELSALEHVKHGIFKKGYKIEEVI